MKKIYSLLLLLLMAVMGLHAEKEIYGVYNGTMLTIQYDENRDANDGVTDWWEGQYCGLRDAVTTVEIDASMTDARPTRTKGWFGGFEKLEQINGMENLNTSSTTDMSDMFSTSAKLASIDLSHFDTRNVRSMSGMFMACESLKELNLLSFDISSLEDVEAMFGMCSNLETIYCALNWEKSQNITSSQDMFYGCEKLKGGKGTIYDEVYVDKSYARPDGGSDAPGYFWRAGDTGEEEADTREVITSVELEGFDYSSAYIGATWSISKNMDIAANMHPVDVNAPYYILETADGGSLYETITYSPVVNDAVLSEGTYYFVIQLRIDGEYGLLYRFPTIEEGVPTVIVDGEQWEVLTGTDGYGYVVEDEYCFIYARSHDFEIAAQGIENTNDQMRKCESAKIIRNGQLLILRGDKTYTITGVEVK